MNPLPLDSSFHLEESFDHYKGGCRLSFSMFYEAVVPKLRGQKQGEFIIKQVWKMLLTLSHC